MLGMKYKHKFTIGDSLDIAYPVHGRIKTEEAQLEMAEVYRKAEALDRIVKIAETSDNHLDFSDKVDSVIKNYQEEKQMNTLLTAPDIEYLRGQQMKLDEDIIRKNGITHNEWMGGFKTKHYLALRVEVHEFINECYDQFKYWKKKPIDRDRIVDEAVDVLHFVVLHWNKSSKTAEENQRALYGCLHNIDADFYLNTEEKLEFLSQDWGINNTLAGVLSVLDDYNFTTQDIIEAYNRKNKVNFERLESGY